MLHSDITASNVVLTSAQESVAIDNESVSQGRGRALDVWVTASSLYSWKELACVPALVAEYDKRLPGSKVIDMKNFFMGILLLRKALKARERHRYYKQHLLNRKALEWFSDV